MRIASRTALILAAVLPVAAGCRNAGDARYIYQDGEFGVIGIPQNSPYGRKDFRKQAEELMARHFPGGYEIVRAEEVVEGQRVLDKSKKSEFATEPGFAALDQKISLGKIAESMMTQQKDSLPILESRIIYRRRSPGGPPVMGGYSAVATLAPPLYLDPNDMARCRERIELAELKKAKTAVADANSKDDATKKVAHGTPSHD